MTAPGELKTLVYASGVEVTAPESVAGGLQRAVSVAYSGTSANITVADIGTGFSDGRLCDVTVLETLDAGTTWRPITMGIARTESTITLSTTTSQTKTLRVLITQVGAPA